MSVLSRIGLAILAALGSYTAAVGHAVEAVHIGDLVLSFDSAVWRIEGGNRSYKVYAIDAQHDGLPITIEMTEGSTACTPAAVDRIGMISYPDAWERKVATLRRPGFDLHIATLDMGCRNWTGSPVFACAAFRDKSYFIIANPGGCRGTPPNYDGPVIELLNGLAAP